MMIGTVEALELVLLHGAELVETIEIDPKDALDYVLAKDVISSIDMPPFRQSAMDGYALNIWVRSKYTLIGEIQAGGDQNPELMPGQAVRIFTGAAVPDSATAVVMQERVSVEGNRLTLNIPVHVEMNIRPKGEQIKRGAIALFAGTTIKGAHIGFLAGLGVTKIRVCEKPSIAIVVTGNELVAPGKPLSDGKIYESNGAMLKATLDGLGYKNATVRRLLDDYEETKKVLDKIVSNFDVVIVTGGVSVGEYDFVGKALHAIGVQEIFYKVRQKPGKPLFFGKKGQTSIVGLPGNPAAALTCFYIYVYPLLKKCEGAENPNLLAITLPLLMGCEVSGGDRAQFLKARINEIGVEILGGQSSAMVRAFGDANGLVFLPEHSTVFKKGELVKTILLPNT